MPLLRLNPRSRRGMALVITLSLIVLLAFLIIALFSRAIFNLSIENTNSGGVEASLLAKSGANLVISDLQAEIRASSTATNIATTNGTVTNYYPLSPQSMLPSRQLLPGILAADTNFLNLVKQSGVPMFTNAPSLSFSSSESTTNPSANGRSVSTNRWDAPLLTGAALPNSPHWIYINRDSSVSASATSASIGRIAFNVYDIGGLLDINVAGFAPSKSSGADPTEMPGKGSQVWADLRALPGIASGAYASTDAWPPQWRLTGDWLTFNSATNSSGKYVSSLPWYRDTGWLQPYSDSSGSISDRMFTSRQDLINYAKANPATFPTANGRITALQYLTTFSRDLDLPSYQPDPGRPKVTANQYFGGNNANPNKDNLINPSLFGAYASSGTTPLSRKRFNLSNLSLVASPTPPNSPTGDAQKIYNLFGLTWTDNNTWTYNHGGSTTISNLQDITNRAPDFFEVLKAAIIAGSLGKQFGFSFPVFAGYTAPNVKIGGTDSSIDQQIIQIGANIIDQYDGDSYPTHIQFNGMDHYGVEDLPRIYRAREYGFNLGDMPYFKHAAYVDPANPSRNEPEVQCNLFVHILSPEIWNPHQAPPVSGASSGGPTKFRIIADSNKTTIYSKCRKFWDTAGNTINAYFNDFRSVPGGPNFDPLTVPQAGLEYDVSSDLQTSDAEITFSVTQSGAASFREPMPLAAVGFPDGSGSNGTETTDMKPSDTVPPGLPDAVVTVPEKVVPNNLAGGKDYHKALGFVTTYMPYARKSNAPEDEGKWLDIIVSYGGPIKLIMQYQVGGKWYTMDVLNVAFTNVAERFEDDEARIAGRIDPRTERWGSFYCQPADTGRTLSTMDNTFYMGLPQWSSAGNNAPYNLTSPGGPPGWTQGPSQYAFAQVNGPASATRYTDADGVLRYGDAYYDTSFSKLPSYLGATTSRPIILNRPFRSVAELGYAFRDVPWKSLDFMTPQSGDAALLDAFSISDSPDDGIVAGRVNLNTRQIPVLAALLQNTALASGARLSQSDATAVATKLVDFTQSTAANKGPLRDRAELVGRFVSGATYSGPAEDMGNALPTSDSIFKTSRNALMTALADAGTTRAWTFLIDIVAQSGSPSAGNLSKFNVNGEQHLWMSVSIDRFTGKVLGTSTEIVTE